MKKRPIYLDSNATTPMDPRVVQAMEPYWTEKFGNASSSNHSYGWEASAAVDLARQQVAQSLGCKAREVYFTSGATESNNMALLGVAYHFICPRNNQKTIPHIITTSVEHKCVLEVCSYLEGWNVEVTYLPVDSYGQCQVKTIESAIKENTQLISVIFANNEVGTINPIKEIGALAKSKRILFHTDAAQAVGKMNIDVNELNIDLLSLSGHKIYGPKGVGALYVRSQNPEVNLVPIQYGGSQEQGLRPGTINVPGVVGLGKALEIAIEDLTHETQRITQLRNQLMEQTKALLPNVQLNGHPTQRLCNNLSLTFSGFSPDALVSQLSGVAFSSSSACSSEQTSPSYVLKAIGLSDKMARATLRFGLSRFTTEEQIIEVLHKLKGLCN